MAFVTGGTGLVGSHLLYELAKNSTRIRALCRKGSRVEETKKVFSYYDADSLFSRIEWIEGDVLDIYSLEKAMEGASHVYHCAALVSMNRREHKEVFHLNVAGTVNMLHAAQKSRVKKFCFVSSVASLGTQPNGALITEETHWDERLNFSPYSISKYLAEKEVWRAAEEGLDMIIVNPSIIIGAGNWHRSSGAIFRAALKGFDWYTSGGMGFVDVRDAVRAMIMLMESEIKNERFILSSENMLYKDFMSLVYASLGKPAPKKKASRLIIHLAWVADALNSMITRSKPLLTKELIRFSSVCNFYSNEKIHKKLGIEFIPVRKSLQDTAKHFLSELSK